jgi:L-fuculose-phosphate aldolase
VSAELRAAVVAAAREMLHLGLVAGTEGNVSVRDADSVLITPSATPYEAMSEDDVVAIDSRGEPTGGAGAPSSEWRVHVAIYAARPDLGAIVHTHSKHATAWSHLDEPLGTVLTARTAATGTDEIAAAAVEALGDRGAVLLGRHGVVGVGSTAEQALQVCISVEEQAAMALSARK